MKFSQMAAKYFSDVEIIELHHDEKRDAPSGTAVKTAEMIANVREEKKQGHPDEWKKSPALAVEIIPACESTVYAYPD